MPKSCQTEFSIQRKELLERSLVELMDTVRYQDITVKDICQQAGIPRRTFYHYFDSKEDVLDSIVETLMTQCYMEVLFDVYSGTMAMEKSFTRVFQFWQGENRRKLDLLYKNGLGGQLMSHATDWIKAEQVGFFRNSHLDPKLVEIGLMVGITDFFSLLFYWSRNGYQETPEQMAQYAMWVLPQAFYRL